MPKYNVRRKAQLGLDIREGGIAIPIANNMFYIDGRKHAAGGVTIGPNNKNGVEVEGGEVVEMIDSNHPSVGRQFKAGGQQQTMRVFSSVPFLRGVSPAELVMEGANPDAVFKAQEEFKDRNRINDDGTTYEVGGEKIYTPSKSIQRQIQETGRIIIGGAPTIGGLRTAKYVKGLATTKGYMKKINNNIFNKADNYINKTLQGLINKHKITSNQADAYKKFYNEIIGVNGVNIPKTISLFTDNEMKYGGRVKAPFGLETPIEGGYYPKSSEPETIKWLSDWLNGRRVQLYENAASSPSHSFYYSKPFDEIRGLSKGISANRLQTNRVFYSLINNAASATHKIGNTVSTIASGQYDKKANEITYPNSNIDMNSSIHERTHAMKSKPQTVKIKSILGDRYKQPWGEPDPNSMTAPLVQYMNQYLSDPEEIYSRMMEYRYNSKLKPSDKVDVNQLNNNRKLLENLNLHYISDEDLMNLFNNVAANKDNKVKAKFGGSMIYTINGNVKNGLSHRSKAQYGLATKYLKKKNKTTEKPAGNKQKDEPKVLDIRNTTGYKIKQAVENPWVKYPVEVASYLLSGATAKGMNLIGTVGKKAAKEVVNKTDDVVFKFGKTRKNKEDIILNTVDEIGISNRFTKPVETTISYKPQTRFRDGKTYVVKEKTIKKVAEKRFTPKKEVIDKNITTYTPPKNNAGNTINFEDAIIVRKQMDPKTSRELDKVYRKAVGNKEPKSGFGRVPQQTTIEYTPKGESINAYDASVEFHKRVSDMLYDSYVKKYGKKGVDKAMKREHISKYEYGGRIKAEGGKFLKYKNGVFTDPESGEEYDVDPEVFKMYGNSFEEGVIPLDDRQYRGKLRIITNPRNQKTGDSYIINPLTGEWIRNGVTETSEPSVKGNTKVTSKSSSTARGRGTKVSTPKAASQSTPTIQDTLNKITADAWKASKTPKIDLSKVEMPTYNVSDLSSKETKVAKAKFNTPLTGSGTQSKEAPWLPQYNTITGRDWLGVGTNLAGHIASYFANNALLKKAPMPIKPVQFQAAKLKTTHNINPDLANINEVTQMNLAEVGRNTASSNTSIARKQRIMNEARDAKNKLYGQKENIETQLINLDRRNRQDVYNRNIAAYNDWLDKTYAAKSNNLLNKQRNLTNLISGIPMAVNTMLGTIENRKSTNDMIRAIAAANPNVDGRLLGIGDYYTQKQSNGRIAVYNKNHKLVKYV